MDKGESRLVSISGEPLLGPPRVRHIAKPWTFDGVLLNASRVFALLVGLAQAVAALALVLRRRQVQDATLLLDSANGLYAAIGIVSCCNSLVILFVGGTWELTNHYYGTSTEDRPPPVDSFIAAIPKAMMPLALLRGQHMVDVPAAKNWVDRITPFKSSLPPLLHDMFWFSMVLLGFAISGISLFRRWKYIGLEIRLGNLSDAACLTN